MTWRVLDPLEWGAIAHTPLGVAVAALPPDTQLLVVEDDAGAVIGTWAVLRYVHVHGLWIDPAHRKRAGVFRRLLEGMRTTVTAWGHTAVLTSADAPDIEAIVRGLGGREIPGVPFVFPVGGRACP